MRIGAILFVTGVILTPAAPGPYRLFVIATDGAGNAAYATMPFCAGPYKQP